MRSRPLIRYLKLIFLLPILVAVPGLSQSTAGAGSTPAFIQDLSFGSSGSQTLVTVSADRLIDYTSYYPNPRLFILDIPEAQSRLSNNFLAIKTDLVDFATVSQIGEGKKSLIRIEFNLNQPIQYALQGEGSKVQVIFSSSDSKLVSQPELSSGPVPLVAAGRPTPTSIQDVAIQESGDQVEFRLLTSAQPAFKYFELDKPQRLVIDIENSTFKVLRKSVVVNSDLIQRLRFGNGESSQGKLVRCVFDLSHRTPYRVVGNETGLVVRFQKSEKPALQVARQKALPPTSEPLSEPGNFPQLEEFAPGNPLALDVKPLVPVGFLQGQPLAQPIPPTPPLEIPQLGEPAPLTEIGTNGHSSQAELFQDSPELAEPSISTQRVLHTEVPEPSEPEPLPQLAMNNYQPESDLLVGPVHTAEPRLSESAIPLVKVPEVRDPEPLSQIANSWDSTSNLYASPLNLSRPLPASGSMPAPSSPAEKEKPPSSPAQKQLNMPPPQPTVEQPLSVAKPVVVAQADPSPAVLKARTVPPQAATAQAPIASPDSKVTMAQPKPVALLTQQPTAPAAEPLGPAPQAATTTQPAAGQIISQPSSPVAPKYSGELISLELKDADLKDFFRLIGEISGLNIVLDPDVKGSLTIFLNDVPWDQALDVVLKNNSLGKQIEGNVLRIATNATLEGEETQRKRLADARVLAAELQTETRVLSYAKATDLSAVLKKVLSPRGEIIVDPRTNSMVISDIPGKFPAIDALTKQLDKKIRQVEIEARVIAANRNFLRDIGIQWGAIMGNNAQNKLAGALPGNPFSRTPPPSVSVPPTSGSGGSTNAVPLNVNLPATAATSSLSGFVGFTNNFILDVIITAAESHGNARLLSKPKILTQDNIEGFVQQGVKIPVQTTINNTISVQFFDFALKLRVTPQITEEGTIMLNVNIENSTPDFSRTVQGVPTVNTQETRTTILVNNGGTVVVGGVLIDNEQVNVRQVPGFGSLPLIGNIFKERSVTKQTQELVFFLTPRIL